MATPEDVLTGIAAAMESAVPSLTTAIGREADGADNTVTFPYGDVSVVSNIRADQWNTDIVGYATDTDGNKIGFLLDAKFNIELQMSIWIAVPSDTHDIQSLGTTFERFMRRYDESRRNPDPLPDGAGGTLTDVNRFRLIGGGELPLERGLNPPLRGYQLTTELRFTDRIDTSVEYGAQDYVATVDHPASGDLTDTDETDDIAIEYIAT